MTVAITAKEPTCPPWPVIPSVAPLLENQEKALLFLCGHPCLEQLGRHKSVPITPPHKENHFTAQDLKVGCSGRMETSFILLSNPTLQLIQTGKGEAIRIRSILRSLVPTEDLVGIISIPLKLPSLNKGKGMAEDSPASLPRATGGKKVLVTQSCLTLCNPMDCSPPGSSVQGILQARIPEGIATSFSRGILLQFA